MVEWNVLLLKEREIKNEEKIDEIITQTKDEEEKVLTNKIDIVIDMIDIVFSKMGEN